MKKIAIITKNTTFNKYFGGLEVHTKSLIENLSQDYELHIFAPKRELKIVRFSRQIEVISLLM